MQRALDKNLIADAIEKIRQFMNLIIKIYQQYLRVFIACKEHFFNTNFHVQTVQL